jgi:TDG/mug DNA glycosylase family protein
MSPSISTRRGKEPWRPTKEQLAAAVDKRLLDVVQPGLAVLFCGINPGLYSGATGHHFAKPGNRFWPALHRSGFTPRLYSPFEDRELPDLGLGITNIVNRTTAMASELTAAELRRGAGRLRKKVLEHQPRYLAVLGMQAYRIGFDSKAADIGLQPDTIGATKVWLLPNPSGLNAHYQLPDLVRVFRALRRAAF